MIRESVGGIVTTRYDASMSATVGLDTPLKELDGMLLHDSLLPGLQDDRPLMFSSGAVLRKQDRPAVGVGIDDRDGSTTAKPNRPARTEHVDRPSAARYDMLLPLVQRDLQSVGSARASDVPVAQIHPEHVAVGRVLRDFQVGRGRWWGRQESNLQVLADRGF